MAGRLRAEAWTLPTSATFEKICDVPMLAGSSGTRELSAYSDESIHITAADFEDIGSSIISTTAGSLIRIYDGSTVRDEFVAERVSKTADRPGVFTISGPQINGLIEKCAVYPYNYPNDSPEALDWIWGGANKLPDLGLGDLGNVNEEYELWNDATSGTFTITVDGQTTSALTFDDQPDDIERELQALSTVNDVTVSGVGDAADNPWIIVFYDPPDPASVTVTDSLSGGSSTLTKVTEGVLDPSPITQSQRADQRVEPALHGTYAEPPIQVVENNLDTDADWALLVNATGQFAGSQIVVSVTPGQTYQASMRVKPTAAGKYRLVVRDIYENLIKASTPFEQALTAGSYQTLSISDVVIPPGVTEVILRVAVVQPTYADFYVNWQGATFNEGLAATTPGEIVRVLIENAQDQRSAFGFLDISGFSDTVDSDGTSWPSNLSFTAYFGGNSHMGHVLGDLHEMGDTSGGYEWRITPKASPSGGLTHDLELYVPGGGGTDHTASTGGPSVIVGGGTSGAELVQRVPAFTDLVVHGTEGLYLEDADTTARTNFGRWERIVDAEHIASTASLQEFADASFADQASNLTAAQATVRGDDQTVPMVDYDAGDTIWWQFPGILDKEARRVRRVSWVHDDLATYTVQGSRIFTTGGGMAAAVDKLLNQLTRRRRRGGAGTPILGGSGGAPTIVVAASNASDESKGKADFICPGTAAGDTALFNTVTDLINSAAGSVGGRLLLTEGIFNLNASYNSTFNGIVQGMGQYQTVIVATGDPVFEISGSGGGVRDLSIQSDSTCVSLATFFGFVENCFLSTTGSTAVLVAADACTVRANFIESSGYGVRTDDQDSAVIIGNYIFADGDGVHLDATSNQTRVIGNYINSSASGVHVTGANNLENVVLGNYILATTGVEVDNALRLVVVDNHISAGGNGIDIDTVTELTVRGNVLYQPSQHGIVLLDTSQAIVESNIVDEPGAGTNNTYDGILLTGDSDENLVHHNRVTPSSFANDTRFGVNVSASTCNSNIVVGNQLGTASAYGSDAFGDSGTSTVNTYPNDATYGDNFTL